jgi:hypothetical protein
VSVDDRVSVFAGPRIFGRHIIVRHSRIGEHSPDAKVIAVFVRRIMTLDNIAVESRTIVDTEVVPVV